MRRLVVDPRPDVPSLQREAAELGLQLADAYRPALLVCKDAAPRDRLARRLEVEAARRTPGTLFVPLNGTVALLRPEGTGQATEWTEWLEELVGLARRLEPRARAQAISVRAGVGLGALPGCVARLDALRGLPTRAQRDQCVVFVDQLRLDRLLRDKLDTFAAMEFVDAVLGDLLAWDRGHGSDLLGVLEAALDLPSQERAAQRCFMHRNTFRHRLRQAAELVDDPLDDPDRRLAVHVALKLRKLLPAAASGEQERSPRRSR